MIIVWFLLGIAVVAVVSTWAWRFQMRALNVVGLRLAHLAGKPGTLVDVELTAVMDHHSTVLMAFQPAGLKMRPGRDRSGLPPASTLVLSLPDDQQVALARLKRWQTSGAPVLLWRDPTGELVELSQVQTGQTVRLRVEGRQTPSIAV